jgi:hypothetical protein
MKDHPLRPLFRATYVVIALGWLSISASAQQNFFSGCGDVKVTSVSHEDTVVMPLHIHAETTCSKVTDLQLWVDSSQVYHIGALTLDFDLTSLSVGSHRVVVQGVDGTNTVQIKSQALTINVAQPATGMTTVVNVWNPTGCPAANSCSYAENVPSTFYVDAKAYSNQPNIHDVQVWLDGVKKDENISSTPVSAATFHSTVALQAAAGNHRLVVQATDTSAAVVGQTVTYFNVTSSNLGSVTNMEGISTDPALNLWLTCSQSSGDPCFSSTYPTTFTQGTRTGVQFYSDSGAWGTAQRHYQWPNGSVSAPPTFNPNPSKAYSFPFKYVKYEFDIYVPTGATNAINNIEWEVQQRLPDVAGSTSFVRNMAFEDNYDPSGTKEWRAYDFYAKAVTNDTVTTRWQSVGVPNLKFTENQWYHVVLESHLDESISGVILVRHDAISAYPVGGATTRQGTNYHNSHIVPTTTSGDETTNAIQLGNNGSGATWGVLIDNLHVTYTW